MDRAEGLVYTRNVATVDRVLERHRQPAVQEVAVHQRINKSQNGRVNPLSIYLFLYLSIHLYLKLYTDRYVD